MLTLYSEVFCGYFWQTLSYGYSLLCINGESITDAVLERFVSDELSCINLTSFIKSEIPQP